MPKLSYAFYEQKDVVSIAVQLLGKQLFTLIEGKLVGGTIVETAVSYTHLDVYKRQVFIF